MSLPKKTEDPRVFYPKCKLCIGKELGVCNRCALLKFLIEEERQLAQGYLSPLLLCSASKEDWLAYSAEQD